MLPAGEHNKRTVDHFPVSRASHWKGNPNDQVDMLSDINPIQSTYGAVADEDRARKLVEPRKNNFDNLE